VLSVLFETIEVDEMTKTVAFLRAINVGGHTVRMETLRGLFAQLGYCQVITFIASGNVIFDAPQASSGELEEAIEAQLNAALGYAVTTFTRTAEEIAAAVAYNPFPGVDVEGLGFRVYAGFLKSEPDREARERLMEFRSPVDDFNVHGREVYWLCRVISTESNFSGAVLEKALRKPATLRNMTTVRKIAKIVGLGS
jgi:uncharacterized protein (DUF1697 family)